MGLPWSQPGWRARVQAWIDGQVERPRGDAQEVKIRPWSAVLRQPTGAGDVYFKANLPALANEPELTRRLHRICPQHVLGVVAEEPGEGWMLQPDGGPTLGSVVDGTDDRARLEGMLAVYAEVQVRAAGHVHELLGAGAPDRRLPRLHGGRDALAGPQPWGRAGGRRLPAPRRCVPRAVGGPRVGRGPAGGPRPGPARRAAHRRTGVETGARRHPRRRGGRVGDALAAWLHDLQTELDRP